MLGRFGGEQATLETVHRFSNVPLRLPEGLHWNLPDLFSQTLSGLGRAAEVSPLAGVGIDAWGVDYALLDSRRRLLGLPFHYRDSRTDGMVSLAHERVSREELYAIAGIQTIAINTVFQLLADQRASAPIVAATDRIALIADLFAYWLTGVVVNEATAASTTGLLDARSGRWAHDIVGRLGLPGRPFSRDPVEPGLTLGAVLSAHEPAAAQAVGVPVHAVASHDTASAFVGTPLSGRCAAILSSGTWSLFGLELDQPVLTTRACAYNLSNERGIDGTIRLLANVMGLWLVQQCRQHWEAEGHAYDYRQLLVMAAAASGDVAVFDPDGEQFIAPGDMPARIRQACSANGQRPPNTPGEVVRCVLQSLACKYRLVLERLEHAAGVEVEVVHVIGGGAQNELLCQLTATMLGRPVLAGPVEATALGNVLVQARANGELGSLAEMRAVAANSTRPVTFEPGTDRGQAEETYGRFLGATGLGLRRAARAGQLEAGAML